MILSHPYTYMKVKVNQFQMTFQQICIQMIQIPKLPQYVVFVKWQKMKDRKWIQLWIRCVVWLNSFRLNILWIFMNCMKECHRKTSLMKRIKDQQIVRWIIWMRRVNLWSSYELDDSGDSSWYDHTVPVLELSQDWHEMLCFWEWSSATQFFLSWICPDFVPLMGGKVCSSRSVSISADGAKITSWPGLATILSRLRQLIQVYCRESMWWGQFQTPTQRFFVLDLQLITKDDMCVVELSNASIGFWSFFAVALVSPKN